MWWEIRHDRFVATGFVGWISLALILILSLNPIRSACYEAFVVLHLLLALTIFAAAIAHCNLSGFNLPQTPWIIAVAALWALERLARALRLVTFSFARGRRATAEVEVVGGAGSDVCRVTLHLPRHVDIRPGTHAYLRLMAVRPWETHPFSIAWVEHHQSPPGVEKSNHDELPQQQGISTSVSFVVCAQSGFTRQLLARTRACGGRMTTSATFEGPYDGLTSLDSYGHVVLVAGATGITHQLRYARRLVLGHKARTTAARRILLVWVVRQGDALDWVRPWLDEILKIPECSKLLTIRIFVTRECSAASIPATPAVEDSTILYSYKRPDINAILQEEVDNQIGAMFVMVCGPGGLSDDVRAAVRSCQTSGREIEFEENGFSW